ncbi:MAG: 16S rRNA (guanine(527)-N(7))-methyltransferase RsmG [Cohnella sp.]|nr:16S rRNA (guanine(527)-N(7))-methyltransferase RsmG [Cohnella sp.]
MDKVHESFANLLSQHSLAIGTQQLAQFETYYRELVAWNEKMNLTGITEREQVYIKHFYDSLSVSFLMPFDPIHSVADIGSGAGFPGIPLKIMFPHLQLTIVDSLKKRIGFLQHIVQELGLHGVTCVHGRAEDAARLPQLRDNFDLVAARAVAKLQVLNELCLPFVKKEGTFVAMKGADPAQEIDAAAFSLRELRAELTKVVPLQLPMDEGERHLIVIRKTGSTPARYPRKAGLPLKEPLEMKVKSF